MPEIPRRPTIPQHLISKYIDQITEEVQLNVIPVSAGIYTEQSLTNKLKTCPKPILQDYDSKIFFQLAINKSQSASSHKNKSQLFTQSAKQKCQLCHCTNQSPKHPFSQCEFCGKTVCHQCMHSRLRLHPLESNPLGSRHQICGECDTRYLSLQLSHPFVQNVTLIEKAILKVSDELQNVQKEVDNQINKKEEQQNKLRENKVKIALLKKNKKDVNKSVLDTLDQISKLQAINQDLKKKKMQIQQKYAIKQQKINLARYNYSQYKNNNDQNFFNNGNDEEDEQQQQQNYQPDNIQQNQQYYQQENEAEIQKEDEQDNQQQQNIENYKDEYRNSAIANTFATENTQIQYKNESYEKNQNPLTTSYFQDKSYGSFHYNTNMSQQVHQNSQYQAHDNSYNEENHQCNTNQILSSSMTENSPIRQIQSTVHTLETEKYEQYYHPILQTQAQKNSPKIQSSILYNNYNDYFTAPSQTSAQPYTLEQLNTKTQENYNEAQNIQDQQEDQEIIESAKQQILKQAIMNPNKKDLWHENSDSSEIQVVEPSRKCNCNIF